MKIRINPFLGTLAVIVMAQSTYAADATWNVNGGGNWVLGTNWSTASAPGSTSTTNNTDTARFDTATLTGAKTINVDSGRNIGNITLNIAGTNGVTLTGGSLLLSAGGTTQVTGTGTGSAIINSAIILQGNHTISNVSTTSRLGGGGGSGATITTAGGLGNVSLTLDGAYNAASVLFTGIFSQGSGDVLTLVKNGVGSYQINGVNTFTGGVMIKQGFFGLGNGSAAGTGTITLGDSTIGGSNTATLGVGSVTAANAISVAAGSSGALSLAHTGGGAGTLNGNISLANNLTIAQGTNAAFNINGSITGTGNVSIKATAGTGITTIGTTTASINFTGLLSNDTSASASPMVISGVIGSNLTGLAQNSSVSKLTLTGANSSFVGDTSLSAGTLQLQNTNSLQNSVLKMNGGSVAFGTSATVGLTSVALGGLSGSGNVNLNNFLTVPTAVALTIGNSNSSNGNLTNPNTLTPDYSGVLSNTNGSASLTKVGTNTQILSGNNTYSGATQVNGGKLLIGSSGSLSASSAVTVGGATATGTPTLGGGGTIGGATIIAAAGGGAAGTHAPGIAGVSNGIGTQTFSNTLTYGTGSIFEWDLNAGTIDPGATTVNSGTYDKVVANGTVSGTSTFKVVLGGNAFTDAFWNTDKSWSNIFTGTGVTTGTLSALFTTFSGTGIDSSGLVAGRGQFSFTTANTLTWTAVPEPSSALAGLLVAAGLLRRRRI